MLVNDSRGRVDISRTQQGITTEVPGFLTLDRLGHGIAPYRPVLFPQVGGIEAESRKRLEEAWVFISAPLDW